jgi:hypothetical protein
VRQPPGNRRPLEQRNRVILSHDVGKEHEAIKVAKSRRRIDRPGVHR